MISAVPGAVLEDIRFAIDGEDHRAFVGVGRGHICGNAPNKPPRGWPRARRHSTITRKGHPSPKRGLERAASAIPVGLSDPFAGRAPHPQLSLDIARLSSPLRASAEGFRV